MANETLGMRPKDLLALPETEVAVAARLHAKAVEIETPEID